MQMKSETKKILNESRLSPKLNNENKINLKDFVDEKNKALEDIDSLFENASIIIDNRDHGESARALLVNYIIANADLTTTNDINSTIYAEEL